MTKTLEHELRRTRRRIEDISPSVSIMTSGYLFNIDPLGVKNSPSISLQSENIYQCQCAHLSPFIEYGKAKISFSYSAFATASLFERSALHREKVLSQRHLLVGFAIGRLNILAFLYLFEIEHGKAIDSILVNGRFLAEKANLGGVDINFDAGGMLGILHWLSKNCGGLIFQVIHCVFFGG